MSFSLCSENVFILPSFMNDSLARYKKFYQHSEISLHDLQASVTTVVKSGNSLIVLPLWIALVAFNTSF